MANKEIGVGESQLARDRIIRMNLNETIGAILTLVAYSLNLGPELTRLPIIMQFDPKLALAFGEALLTRNSGQKHSAHIDVLNGKLILTPPY